MEANPILLQKKYARIIEIFSEDTGISLRESLDIFYHSVLYEDMNEGVSDMHCRSDKYLARELEEEYAHSRA